MDFSKENMKSGAYEIGSFIRDLAVGVLGGAVVLKITDPTYWHYLIVGVILLAIGVALQLIFRRYKLN